MLVKVDSFDKTKFHKDMDQFMKNFDWYWSQKTLLSYEELLTTTLT